MKKVLLISGILLTFVIGVYFYYYSDSQKSVLENSKSKQIISSNSLTMMYETEYQSGEYQVSTETTWPQEGYIFNEALSKCENGGVLTWDDENKKVLLQTNTSDKCYIYFDILPTLADYIITQVYTGINGGNDLYYHDGTTTLDICLYNNVSVYNYDGLSTSSDACNNIYYQPSENIYYDDSAIQIVEWDNNDNRCEIISGERINYDLNGEFGVSFDECNGYAVYRTDAYLDYSLYLVLWIGSGIMQNVSIDANDYSYRYSGADPNNYVCFGTDITPCPTDNLYRIIGVFNNQVKLIKATSYGNYAWDADGGDSTWDGTTKPDIYTTLNETYYNTLSSEWQNLIAETTWQVGGMEFKSTNTVKQYYDEEVGIGQNGYEEIMNIGLMYVSDYGYATSSNYWINTLYNNPTLQSSNWMQLDIYAEHTISNSMYDYVFAVYKDGTVVAGSFPGGDSFTSNSYAIRPTFYLNTDVQYISGTGTESDPYRIA